MHSSPGSNCHHTANLRQRLKACKGWLAGLCFYASRWLTLLCVSLSSRVGRSCRSRPLYAFTPTLWDGCGLVGPLPQSLQLVGPLPISPQCTFALPVALFINARRHPMYRIMFYLAPRTLSGSLEVLLIPSEVETVMQFKLCPRGSGLNFPRAPTAHSRARGPRRSEVHKGPACCRPGLRRASYCRGLLAVYRTLL